MTAASIAAALGLLAAPSIGATVADAFDQLGPAAVFGPGCGDRAATRTIQAPARWAGPVPSRWRAGPVTVMAEFDGRIVTSVHIANQASEMASSEACRAALIKFSGGPPVRTEWNGADLVMTTTAMVLAQQPAKFRAVYRASRHECRTMLTIGA